MMYNGGEGLYTATVQYEKNPHCLACGTLGVPLSFSPDATLQELIDFLIKDTHRFDAIKDPSLVRQVKAGSDMLWMTGFLAAKLRPNLPKQLKELIQDGDLITITERSDKNINYIVKLHFTKPAADADALHKAEHV